MSTVPAPENLLKVNIPKPVLAVVSRLQEQGFQAFLVGGCVRDLLRGEEPKDYDVATDAVPESDSDRKAAWDGHRADAGNAGRGDDISHRGHLSRRAPPLERRVPLEYRGRFVAPGLHHQCDGVSADPAGAAGSVWWTTRPGRERGSLRGRS